MSVTAARVPTRLRRFSARQAFLLGGIVLSSVAFSGGIYLGQATPAPGALQLAGFAVAAAMLCYSLFVWRFMLRREDVECQLQRAKDAADQANSARGEFLSTMSHEIRTPMNAILGMSGLIRMTPLDAQQDGFAKGIEESAQSLMGIIDDILDFSKIDAGKLKIEALEVELLAIVEASVDVLATRAAEKGVRLSSYVDPRLPVVLRGDPGRLRQILLNLLGNAVKFTSSGEIAVSAQLAGEVQGQCRIRFEVIDTGVGIDRQAQDKLFVPFTQADGSVTRKYGGTGLGLSICKRLVGLMGGGIGVKSHVGKGSTFWFELAMPVINPARMADHLTGELLLITPNDRASAALEKYAATSGMSVRSVASLAQGRELASRLPASAVIVVDGAVKDFHLAGFEQARLEWPQSAFCVLLVANADAREDMAVGTDIPVLTLPIKRADFYNVLSGCVAPSRQNTGMVSNDLLTPLFQKKTDNNLPVLLVEDNLMNQQVALHQLHLLGYDVDIAANGQEALSLLEHGIYAAVLMDCQMPTMDGFEATRRIRAREHTSGKHIPVIAMTANAMTGDRERCLEAGMDDYLSKPIVRNRLESVLSAYARQSHTGAAVDNVPEVLDMARLHDMFDDDLASMHAMLSFFVANTHPILQELQRLARQDDFALAGDVLHRLAGSCSNLGASHMTALTNAADIAARQGDGERLRQLAQALSQALLRLQQCTNELKETT